MIHTLFISDLHLDEHHPASASKFFTFMKTVAPAAESVYILGDFFEVWVGDDQTSPLITQVKQALQELSQTGTQVFLMGGNRDFLLGRRFTKETNSQLIKDFTPINLYDQRVLLTHGDALCTLDKDHMRFRKFTNNLWAKILLRNLPFKLRKKIGEQLRERSKRHTKTLDYKIMDVDQTAVAASLQKHQAHIMIHGHTHRPQASHFTIEGQPAQRLVLGSWDRQGCFLKWYKNGKRELVFF